MQVDKLELTGRTLLSIPGYQEKIEFGIEGKQILAYSKRKHKNKRGFFSRIFNL